MSRRADPEIWIQEEKMNKTLHETALFEIQEKRFQAICSCGWISTTSYLEEVDLLRALHAHDMAVFGGER
jgi:hypothetical protein